MRHLIFGAGAVGSLIGGRLALAGCPVTFLARPETAARLRERGLTLLEGDRETRLPSVDVVTSLGEVAPASPPEAIWLAVKTYDCAEAAQILGRSYDRHAPTVVCLLNGIGNEEVLRSHLGPESVIAASLTTAVQRLEPGLIRVERDRGLGLSGPGLPLDALERDALHAGLHPRRYRDAEGMKWSKLLTNVVANATSAILGLTPRQIFAHPGLYRLEIEALRESIRTIRALGLRVVNLPGVQTALLSRAVFVPPALISPLLRRAVVTGRGDKLPSFNYDVGRGRSEVSWLNGAVVNAAASRSLRTPANEVLTHILSGLVESKIDPAVYRGNPVALLREAAKSGVPGLRMYNPQS